MTRLALTHLTLSHYRSHKSAKLDLDVGVIAIYGPNGAGKTNILEAVSLFAPGRGLRRAKAEEFARQPEAVGWKVGGFLESLGQSHEIATWAEPGAARSVTIDDKPASQAALGKVARMVWLVPSMDRLWIEAAEGRRRFLDRITLSFEPKHAEFALAYEKSMRERNRLLKDQVRDAHWYLALESQMAEAGIAIQENRRRAIERLHAAQTSADSAFPTANLTLLATEDAETPQTVEEFTAALAANRQRDLYAGRTLIGPHRADVDAVFAEKGVAAKQCSTGEQKALLISLILANARALSDEIGAPPIVLLDEVAAHLDVNRRIALYEEITALGAQAWMTGTGADLFAELGETAQRIEVTESGGHSEIQPGN